MLAAPILCAIASISPTILFKRIILAHLRSALFSCDYLAMCVSVSVGLSVHSYAGRGMSSESIC